MQFFSTDKKSALEAKNMAQFIAFGPVIFQVARIMRNSGILHEIEASGSAGLTLQEIVARVQLPNYGVRVLLESGLGIGLVIINDERYRITKTGHFILHDPLTIVNMDFMHDVNYNGMFYLEDAIKNERPEGLKVFGNWQTIYEGLSQLPKHVQKSWFAFDHFFSDTAFPAVLPHVYNKHNHIKKLLDIGGNTGKWAIASTTFDPEVHITIMDLPGQLNVAKTTIAEKGLTDRVSFHPANILDATQPFPKGFDAIWMSQFLDCFSEDEITSIMQRCHEAIDENGFVYVLEAFWDKQRFEAAAFCLQQTSVYFTALANGNSQMYNSEIFKNAVLKGGFEIVEEINNIGLSHTLWKLKKRTTVTA
ncbi:methyltransferase domain-containing protein [Panacibacter sp. DH6]|uniref:Methyltransferase domain-containing protein n=1 Tax=Panacibacter microcysteis TaxID=2793269 RepID=A0A931E419_9BACT|nr:methyltransferase [Panacibacter microcysteis]MBG9376668.1 methyltransferase domain-containing protein [Panacibacter microcysteis]